MQKTDTAVKDLVAMVEHGELRLPEMQRGYVWRATRVRDLLDSLYRGYPSGNILVWETSEDLPQRDMAVAQSTNPYSGHKLLLDGQQRITSLSAVIRGEKVKVKGRKRPVDILFNLDHPDSLEEVLEVEDDGDNDPNGIDDDDNGDETLEGRIQKLTFVVASGRIASLPNWVSVTKVFKTASDAEFLKRVGVTDLSDPRLEKYTERLQKLRAIRDYRYSVQILGRDLSYEEVTEIFVRVNSLGAKLRSSDLALAQVTARWRGALAEFEEFEKECADVDFPLSVGLLVRAMVIQATGQSRFKTVSNIPIGNLKTGWEAAKDGIRFAIHFLKHNVGVESPALLSSPFLVLTLAFITSHHSGKLGSAEEKALRFWVRVANGRGRYSRGSSETLLDQDLAAIRSGKGIGALIEAVRQQFGRLHFDVEELVGRNQRASVFRLMFPAMKAAGASDWSSGIGISATSYGTDHKLQFHHVFPKALLRGKYSTVQINDIANLAFISGKTNREISAKSPQKYLAEVEKQQGEAALEAHCVPRDKSLWMLDSYPDFLEARRRLIVARLNEVLGEVPQVEKSVQSAEAVS